jgi:diguanylate cyclase (GGDEF)-like protein
VLDRMRLDDERRLNAMDHYDVLDTPSEEAFDRITRLCCRIFNIPMSTVTFIDGHRQWFKSRQGVASMETPREWAFCAVPTAEGRPLVVPDAKEDSRFSENPLVLGEPNLRFYAGVPLRGSEGEVIGTFCAMDTQPRTLDAEQTGILHDLAQMVERELELRRLATTDSLTGALSRRAFRSEGQRAIDLALRHRYELSCIALDIDHFKAVNDASGHAAGDAVLKRTVETCLANVRKSDLLGRLGGEEFAIILPHAGVGEAHAVAEKIRTAVEQQAIGGEVGLASITASFGVASLGASAQDMNALLDHADQALYAAKNAGRNRSMDWFPRSQDGAALQRRVLKAGSIVFNRGGSTIDCTVRRLSEESARIDVASGADVPERFKLRIESDDFSRACKIVEKSDKHIEVAFLKAGES